MSSKLLTPGSEVFRKKTSEKNLGKETPHPQYPAGFGGREGKQGAPKTKWAPTAVSTVHDPKEIGEYHAMNAWSLRNGPNGMKSGTWKKGA